jgi:hypothetical protein
MNGEQKPYSWDDSGHLVCCGACNGNSVPPNSTSHHYKKCEDCNGTGMVDEFYWQGAGGPPPYWKGNVVDRSGTAAVSSSPNV